MELWLWVFGGLALGMGILIGFALCAWLTAGKEADAWAVGYLAGVDDLTALEKSAPAADAVDDLARILRESQADVIRKDAGETFTGAGASSVKKYGTTGACDWHIYKETD